MRKLALVGARGAPVKRKKKTGPAFPFPTIARSTTVAQATALDRRVALERREHPNLTGLYPYQADGVRWLRARKRGLLADDMGLGKTVQVLRALPRGGRAIVLCPAFLMGNWRDRTLEWAPWFKTVFGLRAPRPGEIVLESYDSLPEPPSSSARTLLPALSLRDVQGVLDEAHYVKNDGADRTLRTRLLVRQLGGCWPLTGTPLPNTPIDLWGVLESAGLATRAFGSWERFLELFKGHRAAGGAWSFDELPDVGARAALERVMLRRMKQEVLPDLPAKSYESIPVPLPDGIRVALDAAERQWIAYGADDLPPFEMLSAAMAELAQAKTGFAQTFVEHAAEHGPVVVWSAHVGPIEAMASLPGARTITGATPKRERAETMEAFQAGKVRVLAATIRAAGVGLDMTASHHCVFIDRAYNPGENEQAEDRLARIGQKSNVLVSRLIGEHALERRLSQILDRKTAINRALLGGR